MTTTQEVIKTVSAAVQEKADVEGGVLVRFIIRSKEWNTKYPVPVKVDKQGAAMMELGHEYTVMLKRERLKKDKTGQYLTDYYWGWNGLAEPGMEDRPESHPSPVDDRAEVPQTNHRDATGVSIERQKSLDIAERAYWAYVNMDVATNEPATFMEAARNITKVAVVFARYIETGKPVAEEPK